jgi:tetratricopeptide (TPR) repeat protein
MVLDPITVAGLASNIVQLVDFSIRIVNRLDDFREKHGDVPALFSNIRIRLPLLIDSLNRNKDSTALGIVRTGQDEALAGVVDGCLAQVKQLNMILDKILPAKGDSFITRNKKALQSLSQERVVEKIRNNLHDYIEALTLHHVVPQRERGDSDLQPTPDYPTCFHIPRYRVSRFIGREDVLVDIECHLRAGSAVVLHGMGGQGKTQIALEYCRRVREAKQFSAILWVDASSKSAAKKSVESISEVIKPPEKMFSDAESRIAFVMTTFSTWSRPWLFVVDNYDDPEAFPDIQDFVPWGEHGAILYTTRHRDIGRYGTIVEIVGMVESEALDLLFDRTAMEETDNNVKHGKDIIQRLGYHPLAIDQAGAYIYKRKDSLGFEDFVDHYNRRKRIILKETPRVWEYRRKLSKAEQKISLSVFTTWELSLQQLDPQEESGGKLGSVLTLFAFFHHANISENLFETYCRRSDKSDSRHSWIKLFCDGANNWDRELFVDILVRLCDLSLVQNYYLGVDAHLHLSLHPLIRDWIRLRSSEAECQRMSLSVAAVLRELLRDCYTKKVFLLHLSARQEMLLHLDAWSENRQDYFPPEPEKYLDTSEIENLIDSESWIADFYTEIGRFEQAKILYEKVLAYRVASHGPRKPFGLRTATKLAFFLERLGQYKEAEKMLQQNLNIQEQIFGKDHPDTLETVLILSEVLFSQGKYVEAEMMLQKSLPAFVSIRGPEHRDTLYCRNNLALSLREQGRYSEAQQIYLELYETSNRIVGSEHQTTIKYAHNLAIVHTDLGMFMWAEKGNRWVLEARERTLGKEHPETLASCNNLVFVLFEIGHFREARELHERVLDAMKKLMGKDHPNTLHSDDNLANGLSVQGVVAKAEELSRRALVAREQILGKEHPHTLRNVNYLAMILHARAKHGEAEQMLRGVLETRQRLLGVESAASLSTTSDLGVILRDQGKYREGEDLLQQAVRGRELVLGRDHHIR